MNNRLQTIGGCAAALVAIACFWLGIRETQSANANVGALACAEPLIDVGRVPWQKRELLFSLANQGSNAVAIERIRKSCACTHVAIASRALKPGEATNLTCIWDTAGRHGQASTDLVIEYHVAGDPALHSCLLSASADILPDYLVDAEELLFLTGESAARTVRIGPARVPSVRVLSARSIHRAFSVDVKDNSTLEVRFDARKWRDESGQCCVAIETDNPTVPNWRIPIRVYARRRPTRK